MDECLFAVKDVADSGNNAASNVKATVTPNLWLPHLFTLTISSDTDERRRMAQNPHEYLINSFNSLVMNPSVPYPTKSN